MPEDYVGKTTKWARDEKTAISYLCKNKMSKDKVCQSKKGATLKILDIKTL